ncbi:MAG: hypothetical protein ACRDIB_20260 [Ardenticatenaceae bacterium]
MNETKSSNPVSSDFEAPLVTEPSGRLVFASGAAGVTIHVAPTLAELCRAHFERHVPGVRVQGGTVTIQYRRFPLLDWLIYSLHEPLAEVTLNGSLPWEIEVRGGVSKLTADLNGLQLVALDVNGGASEVVVTLPRPTGTSYIRVAGGASNVTFHRPAAVAARVRVGSGASNLTLDEQHFGALGGETRWETPDYKSAADRYDIEVVGGASNLTIGTITPPSTRSG